MTQRPYRMIQSSEINPDFAGKCALVVMAKAPRPGRVKTRLSPPLSAAEAAELNVAFLRDTIASLQAAVSLVPAVPVICYTPAGEEGSFRGIVPGEVPLLLQRGDGFGERLSFTVDDALAAGFSAVCLIDSDSPTVPTREYAQAVHLLLSEPRSAVLGPSDDGGYYLIGLNASTPQLFEDIAWSTSKVSAQTRERAAALPLRLHELRSWFDVDDEATLTRLYEELFCTPHPDGFSAPETRSVLAGLMQRILATVDEKKES